jgi:DNA-binding GntR family transcriptional regulator
MSNIMLAEKVWALDREFHRTILSASGREIISALAQRDSAWAESLMRAHFHAGLASLGVQRRPVD